MLGENTAQTRRTFLRTVGVAGLAGVAVPSGARTGRASYETITVPDDRSTIQAAVDDAEPGTLVLLEPGTYEESVEVATPELTIRGTDRNGVVMDGGFDRDHGFAVEADGVALENVTARHYRVNGFYWRTVDGFRGSYLTAYNNGDYGVYAYRSRDGRFEHSYASGHVSAGFYLGRNHPFEAVIENVVAEHNNLGYSGTSAGGDLTIRDSTWRYNRAGIVPNTLDDLDPPQESNRIVNNEVSENHNAEAPAKELTYPAFGTGILLWGGLDNLVEGNDVCDHENFGIAVEPNVVEPSGNVVRENDVGGSGVADLALGRPAGDGNRFAGNEFRSSLPPDVETDASDGDDRVTAVYEDQEERAEGDVAAGDWRDQPTPDDRPTMPDPEGPPRPAEKGASWET
ncbi:right-handed parallel beta-helix repeat-containing protein [Natronococcus wangiae]|uniref:right-handed parallel beta-helix repeat-containing protein n=1 Tax=Natronococcus wangiae TaxID=3068275 RepID=UPI00273DF446|nr:right-handed parallel beta-helix repeat-containing protein [Natronococcus sp. AD5]